MNAAKQALLASHLADVGNAGKHTLKAVEQAEPVLAHLELCGTEPPNGHGPGLGVQWSSDFGAGHAEDHPAAYGGRFPVHPTPRPAAEKEH